MRGHLPLGVPTVNLDDLHQTSPRDYTVIDETPEDKVLRVSNSSNAQKVASAIAHGVYDDGSVTIRSIGAGAVNQAVKAIAIARGYAAPRGLDLVCVPGFQTIAGKEGDISAVIFTVTARRG